MASTKLPASPVEKDRFPWFAAGLHYFSHRFYLRQRFGRRVRKISIDARFSCPNVDGTIADGGCNFCDNRSFSPSRRQGGTLDVPAQIDRAARSLGRRYKCDRFIAYFQPGTNTYAPVDRLRQLYEEALSHPAVVGLAVATRPDCVADDVLDLLADLAGRTYVSLGFGVQTIHDRSLDWIGRGHHYDAFRDAMARSRGRGLEICAQVILGLPGESHADMMATAVELGRQGIDAIKVHNLYAVRDTRLAGQVARGEATLMRREDYVRTVVDFLERLPPNVVVERTSGEAPAELLVGPKWCLDKPAFRAALDEEFRQRGTWQGKRHMAGSA